MNHTRAKMALQRAIARIKAAQKPI
ncbi:MAG: hypothetical protein PHC92_03480 [Syntrophomonadaceae bacterium]|nr:hypothetical protein [Syntrophomonadaceae bacterium]